MTALMNPHLIHLVIEVTNNWCVKVKWLFSILFSFPVLVTEEQAEYILTAEAFGVEMIKWG